MASNIAIDSGRIQAMVEHMRTIADSARSAPSDHAVQAVAGIGEPGGLTTAQRLRQYDLIAGAAEPVAGLAEGQAKPVDFSQVLRQTLQQVSDAQSNSRKMSESFSLGDPNVNLSDVMISMQKASLSFQTTLQVRNRLVSAYREIMTMQI